MYALDDITVGVECQDSWQAELLGQRWQEIFHFSLLNRPVAKPTVCFQFDPFDQSVCRPHLGAEICRSRHLCIYKTQTGFYLRCGNSSLDLDIARSQATGSLDQTFWHYPLEELREFFLLSFLMLLQQHGIYGLHANAVTQEGRGYLIVGDSGHGKTTLAISLIRNGWSYLADDAILLRQKPGEIESLALRNGFSCTQATLARFPEFGTTALESPGLFDGKRLVLMDHFVPDQFISRSSPRVLLFPQIAGGQRSQLVPMDETQTITALMRQSPGILVNRSAAAKQLGLLKQLISQTHSYQLLLGEDVYQASASVSDLLWTVGED
jgi:hypothetical protein